MTASIAPSPPSFLSRLLPLAAKPSQGDDPAKVLERRALELADHATAKLGHMFEIVADLQDDDVHDLLRGYATCVLPMIQALRDVPTRHEALHTHLTLYVDAAVDATTRFDHKFAPAQDPLIKATYLEHLCDLAQHFTAEMAAQRASWQSDAA